MVSQADMQNIARSAMEATRAHLRPGQTLVDVRVFCESVMRELGADSFWYWGIGAFVFAGEGTTKSVSGRDYETPDYTLGQNELITLDLSPQRDGVWGDFARSLVMEDGVALGDARDSSRTDWRNGVETEYLLHGQLVDSARPWQTFDEVATFMNGRIRELGYANLDFRGNLGHSIPQNGAERIYLEEGNQARLGSVQSFTFEPHVQQAGNCFGYKHENIYAFSRGRLVAL